MKLNASQISAAIGHHGKYPIFFLYGPDESGSRALAAQFEAAMGPSSERVDLDGATLKDDPARLSDEATSLSLFGEARYIRVIGGEECLTATTNLLEIADRTINPVVFIGGALKPSSPLLKMVVDHPKVGSFSSYKPEGRNAETAATEIANRHGVRLGYGVAARLIAQSSADRALLEHEIEKIALYLDSAPDRPREADGATMDAVSADLGDVATHLLVDPVLSGNLPTVANELAAFGDTSEWVPRVRAVQRRALLLARLRSEIDGGKSIRNVMAAAGRSIIQRDQPVVEAQLSRWHADGLAQAHRRLFEAEADSMSSDGVGPITSADQLLQIARAADRRR